MLRSNILTSARFGGGVKRYHTWPTLQQQTNADHSFHVLRIWLEIWGAPPKLVSAHIIMHDLGELVVGDLPFPIKSQHAHLKSAVDSLEMAARGAMGLYDYAPDPYELKCVKVCELIEMFEFGVTELLLGNQYALPIVVDTKAGIDKALKSLYESDVRAVNFYLEDINRKALPWKSFLPETSTTPT